MLALQSQANNGLQGYHMGAGMSDGNANFSNFMNPDNVAGNKYPYLLAVLPDGTFPQRKANQSNYQLDLYVVDLQSRDNDALPSTYSNTDLIKLNNLEAIAHAFIYNLYEVGTGKVLPDTTFTLSDVNFKTAYGAFEDNLIVYQCTFTIDFTSYSCPVWKFELANLPTNYDPAENNTVDFEYVIPD